MTVNPKKAIPHGNNIFNNLNEDWERRINKYDYDDDSLSDVGSDDGQSGFAIEFRELEFDDDKRQSSLNDDSASLGTMGIQFPQDFIHEDSENSADLTDIPTRVIQQGKVPGPTAVLASLVTSMLSAPDGYPSLKLPPPIESLT